MIVNMQYEIQNRKGDRMRSYWKTIDMPAAPYKGLVIEVTPDNPVEIERAVQYNPSNSSYFVRFVDYLGEEFYDADEIFEKAGWAKT